MSNCSVGMHGRILESVNISTYTRNYIYRNSIGANTSRWNYYNFSTWRGRYNRIYYKTPGFTADFRK